MALAIHKKRFGELIVQLQAVEATKRYENSSYFPGDRVDAELLLNWRVKARNLLLASCGEDSVHYKQFVKSEEPSPYRDSWHETLQLKAVFEAAREDYEGGYLVSVRTLVQAELFDTELDQATVLLTGGYRSAAAVIAGVVLETTLRVMSLRHGVESGKLERMNADLAKAGIYTSLVQKRVTSYAGVRNAAAHGNEQEFQQADVSEMITYVARFVEEYL